MSVSRAPISRIIAEEKAAAPIGAAA